MSKIDVISWESDRSTLCYRYNSDSIKNGSTLVIHESQTAFFVSGGAIHYEFGDAGTHLLTTQNFPFLNSLRNLPYGGESPYKAEVWYVNQVTIPGLRWGTPTAILLEDPIYKIIVPVTAYGTYSMRIVNARLFLKSLIGNMSLMGTSTIGDGCIKPFIVQNVSQTISRRISSQESSILTISNELKSMAAVCKEDLNKMMQKFGIVVTDFNFMAISTSNDNDSLQRLTEAKNRAAEITIVGSAERNIGNVSQMQTPQQEYNMWHAQINGIRVDGLSYEALSGLISAQVVGNNTLLWRKGMSSWMPASMIEEFTILFNTNKI